MPLRSSLWALGALLFAAAPAQGAPAQLLGKTVSVRFTENRIQKNSDWPNFRPASFRGEVSVYISSEGRAFSRLRLTNQSAQSGKFDNVGDTASGVTSFEGNSMTILGSDGDGARRTVVTFGASFSTCQASMVRAKPAGQDVIRSRSMIRPGITVEIRSVAITGIGCRIRTGNAFADG